MQLTVINSNSKGNCYLLESSTGEVLLIEAGVLMHEIKKALQFNIRRVSGCILTHEHMDHAKAIKDVLDAGITVYSSHGTHKALGTDGHHKARFLHRMVKQQIGSFEVIAYPALHDVADPYCYLIRHAECGVVLFMTDTKYVEYNFKGLNQVIIEANYCQQILDYKMTQAADPKLFLRDRVINSHMSLQNCKETLKAYDLSAVQNIVLIHLSDSHSDELRFKAEVEAATGKMVHVAGPMLKIPFDKQPF